MLIISPPAFRRSRELKQRAAVTPPGPAALMLVGASFDLDNALVMLSFDRAINIAAIDVSAILVNDAVVSNDLYSGDPSGASLASPTTLRLELNVIGDSTGSQLLLNASAHTRIVAVNDGGTWAGVTDLGLPFP